MFTARSFILLLLVFLGFSQMHCNNAEPAIIKNSNCNSAINRDTSGQSTESPYKLIQGALLGTRFKSLEELKSVIEIKYFPDSSGSDNANYKNPAVRLTHCSNGHEVVNVIESGISQGEIGKAQSGDFWDRLHVLIKSPYSVEKRGELSKVYILARRRADLFGEGDPAFYDLAGTMVKNINTSDLAFINARDSTDKGYQNSFDHITAQAFVTSCFSEQLAEFVGNVHERDRPELITGKFPEAEVRDLDDGPVDNYVDLINILDT
jgi:hypothetical protein